MKTIACLFLVAVSAPAQFGVNAQKDPLITAFKVPSRWLSTVIPSAPVAHDHVQIWIETKQPEIEAFKVVVSYLLAGKQSRLEAVVLRNYSGLTIQSFPIPSVDLPLVVDVKLMTSKIETYSLQVE